MAYIVRQSFDDERMALDVEFSLRVCCADTDAVLAKGKRRLFDCENKLSVLIARDAFIAHVEIRMAGRERCFNFERNLNMLGAFTATFCQNRLLRKRHFPFLKGAPCALPATFFR